MLYKRGNVYWCKFSIDGKLYRYSCQTADKKIAEEVENAILGEIVRGKYDLPLKYKPKVLFNEAYANYIKNLSNTKRTIRDKNNISSNFLRVFSDKTIESITTVNIKEYILQRKIYTALFLLTPLLS